MRALHLLIPVAFAAPFFVATCTGGAEGEGEGEGEHAPSCATYCASITANCTAGSAQYESEQACLDFCNGNAVGWGEGRDDDASGNTLGCRQYHAGAAANDDHCIHGGPTGGNACGSYCDTYCNAAMANCTGANALYSDADACHASCARFPAGGQPNDADGNTVQCRIFHLGAAKGDPNGHCSHGSFSGANVCGTWCDVYCDTMADACYGTYLSDEACATACAGFPQNGNIDDASGDSVQCRIFHASVANNDDHCDHANADSTADTCQ